MSATSAPERATASPSPRIGPRRDCAGHRVRTGRAESGGRTARAAWLVARRLAWTVPMLVAISLGIFALAALSPADATSGFLGRNEEFASGDSRDNIAGLLVSGNWLQSWLEWAGSALAGDPGWSTVYRVPVAEVIASRLPWTVLIMVLGLVVAAVVSVAVALGIAHRPGHPVSRIVAAGLWTVSAVPSFLVTLGLMAVFALGLGWLPAGGLTDVGADIGVTQVATHVVLPTLAVALSQLPWMTLHLQESLVGQLQGPAVAAARVRGLSEATILVRHVLPAASIPVLAIAGTRLPEIVAGAALVELVLSWPGLGQSLVDAALAGDLALLATTGVLLTALSLLGGLLADLALVGLDPRVDPRGL